MGNDKIQLFENQPIRTAWVEDEEEWYFSVVDVVQALTESADGRKYWNKLKPELPTFYIYVGATTPIIS